MIVREASLFVGLSQPLLDMILSVQWQAEGYVSPKMGRLALKAHESLQS